MINHPEKVAVEYAAMAYKAIAGDNIYPIILTKSLEDCAVCKALHQDAVGSVFGYIVVPHDDKDFDLIVTFRGTQNVAELVQEAEMKVSHMTEDGFRDIFSRLNFNDVWYNVPIKNLNRVLFTGHSLGGALALLAAEDLGVKTDTIVTFGCPKTLTAVAAATLVREVPDTTHVRIKDDVVPDLPWGSEYVNRGDIIYLPRVAEVLDFLGNHRIESYQKAMEAFKCE